MNIFREFPVLIPIVAALLAEVTKLIIVIFKHEKVTARDIMRAGGTPSGHSSFVAALVFTMWSLYGIKSAEFTLASALAIIVIVDAVKFRRAAGLHAAAINLLTNEKTLDERLGHTPIEVGAGVVFGSLLSFTMLSF